MEESKKPNNPTERANIVAILAKQDVMMVNQEELRGELRHLRDVVIGNGDSASLLNQIKQLEFGQAIAKADRERMERQIGKLGECVTRMERDEIATKGNREASDKDQKKILERLDIMEKEQGRQGDLIAAFRNRVIGIVALLSLLAGAGAGFVAAAKFLETAVP